MYCPSVKCQLLENAEETVMKIGNNPVKLAQYIYKVQRDRFYLRKELNEMKIRLSKADIALARSELIRF